MDASVGIALLCLGIVAVYGLAMATVWMNPWPLLPDRRSKPRT